MLRDGGSTFQQKYFLNDVAPVEPQNASLYYLEVILSRKGFPVVNALTQNRSGCQYSLQYGYIFIMPGTWLWSSGCTFSLLYTIHKSFLG